MDRTESCRQRRRRRRFATWIAALAGLSATLGCVADPPTTEARALAAESVDLDSALELRVEGEPIDATAASEEALPFASAIRATLLHSPALQSALARAANAVAQAEQARLLPNPVLMVLVRFPSGGGSVNVEASLSEELLGLLQRRRRAQAADARLESAAFEAANVALDVVADARTRYAEVQALDERVNLLDERRRISERLLGVARARLEAGEATRLDVTTLQTRLLEIELELAAQRAARYSARLALARRIGAPNSAAEWTLDSWASLMPLSTEERAWIDGALTHHPDLQARRLELAALGDDAALTGWSWLGNAEVGVDAEKDGDWRVGPTASLPLPIFDTGDARGRAALARVIEARHELTQAQRAVVEEVRASIGVYEATRTTLLRVRDELIPLQRQRREQTEQIYLLGESDLTPVLLAESDLRDSLERLVDLEERGALSLARLERAVGGPAARREMESNR